VTVGAADVVYTPNPARANRARHKMVGLPPRLRFIRSAWQMSQTPPTRS
jgi:hypothetical protein